jgi:hypothetical protein
MKADEIGYFLMTGPAAYVIVSQFAGWTADKRPGYQLAMFGLGVISVGFLMMHVGSDSVGKVISIYTVVFAASSFIDVSQPGVIASVLDESGASGVYMLGVALGDVCVSIGYALMVYDSWMASIVGFKWQLSITAFWLLILVSLTWINFAFRVRPSTRPQSLEGLV